ncbi:MAG TPA: hypothetical protein VMN78_13400 [Longimicrobiales bacterium]|nr:hypothetical protein [Longimicrobiales bacterium]
MALRWGSFRQVRFRPRGLILPAMISYGVYRLLHFFGIFLLLTALGGAVMRAMLGGTRTAAATPGGDGADEAAAKRLRRLIGISHGVALFLILLGGFGMLARLDIGMPGWIIGKLGIWLVLGGLLAAANRMAGRARVLWFAIPVLGLLAAWLAYTRPF